MVIKFDLNTIPDNVTISEATLSVYPFYKYYEGENGPKSLFRLTKDWSESSVNWSTPWTTKGGDFSTSALASSNNSSYNVWEDYDVTSAVTDMVENGGNNYGFIFKFDSMTPKKGVSIWSSESSQEDKRPKLTITYESPTSIKPYGFTIAHAERYNVKITNIQGREIASFETRDIKQLNKMMTSLSSGVHIIHITTPNQKFSKQIRIVK